MTSAILARSGDLEWQLVAGEVVILDLRSQCYLSLNRSGARLWPLVIAGTTRRGLVEALMADYDIDERTASGDVEALVAQLLGADLLEEAHDATTGPP